MAVPNQALLNAPKPISLNDDAIRFQVELEFVQCLANPNYLNYLAQLGYFKVCCNYCELCFFTVKTIA